MIPDWLQHLHGTPHGSWYYGCQCYDCYAANEHGLGRVPMTREEAAEQDRIQEEIEAMTPEDRDEFFRLESEEMMRALEHVDGCNMWHHQGGDYDRDCEACMILAADDAALQARREKV